MKDNFDTSLEMLLKHEGGFVDHPKDPGGMTNLGVTKAVYEKVMGREVTEQEMRDLTAEDVGPIYKALYWDKCSCDTLPPGVDWAVFDWAVNSGPSRASKALQRAVGASPDGAIGPKTLAQVQNTQPHEIIEMMTQEREIFYRALSTFDTFGKGWLRRNNETREAALEMAVA